VVFNKKAIHAKYTQLLENCDRVEILQPPIEVDPFIPFRVILKTKLNESSELMEHLRKNDVEPREFFYPLHKQPAFSYLQTDERYDDCHFTISNHIYDNYICLPSFVSISEEQVKYVVQTIKSYYKEGQSSK
jgi:dTDP-4-amino-4,6-dideoxygalactose transaminase